ncbi:MAG TPA: ATP-binding cassette domain-containing protein [Solirubrobacteraceae bacterium]|jgi:ABC-2 type transport system ATP-binding protein|nr:ATP-binding cassette domain-containing protein [Solirubrobacteraceae bacterium]
MTLSFESHHTSPGRENGGARSPALLPEQLAVQTFGLGKRFGSRVALDGVDLEVPRGCAFGFLGPNGAGKTTLIRLLLGLATPTSGRMRLLGRELPGRSAEALARVGAIIEEPRFHPHLSGRENLAVHAAARERAACARIDGALARVGLGARADDRVKAYSLGMRQRLGIARCLLADPELLILDEPLNGLDPAGIGDMRRLIRELVAEGSTVLLSSHLLDEVQRTCDAAAIVDDGRIIAQGTIGELTGGGPRAIDVGCDDAVAAEWLLAGAPGVSRASQCAGGLRLELVAGAPTDREVVTEVVRRLLAGGIAIDRVSPVAVSLEQRFLTMTTRLKDRS